MGIFPKSKSKSVKKFYNGGQMSSSPTDPVTGVGIQYVASTANIPNLDAIKYFDSIRRQSDQNLEAERQKLMPNEQAARDLILKLPGTSGQKELLLQETIDSIKNFRSKAKKNINWVFSDEGRSALSKTENIIGPGKFQKLNENYSQLQANYEMAYKNNTLDNYQVRDGRISVVDVSDGKRKDIALREYESDVKSDKPKYNPIKIADAYDLANNEKSYDLTSHKVYGDMYNAEQAKNELRSYFNNTGSTGQSNGIVSTKSNASQRAHAKKQAFESLSQKSREALQSEYIKLSKGHYDEKQFNAWVSGMLDEESAKRAVSDNDINMTALNAFSKPGKGEPSGSGYSITSVPENRNYPVIRDKNPANIFGSKTVDLHLVSRGQEPDQSIKPLSLNGDYPVFGDTFGGAALSEDKDGKPVRISKTYKNTQHVENAVMAVTSGRVLKRNKDGSYTPKKEGDAGTLLIKDEGYQYGIPKDAQIQQDNDPLTGRPYLYFENNHGDRIIAEMQSFGVYNVYGDNDKDATELDKKMQVFVPDNRKQSLGKHGVNYSGERHNEIHFYRKGSATHLTNSASNILTATIDYARQNNPEYAKNIYDAFLKAQAGDWEAKNVLNQIINEQLDQIDDENIKANLLRQKLEYTPHSATDNRNFSN